MFSIKVSTFNAEAIPTELDETSHNQWTDVSACPSFVVGEQVNIVENSSRSKGRELSGKSSNCM